MYLNFHNFFLLTVKILIVWQFKKLKFYKKKQK